MNAVVIEHVKVSELPENWRAKLHTASNARVTVRIEEEPITQSWGQVLLRALIIRLTLE